MRLSVIPAEDEKNSYISQNHANTHGLQKTLLNISTGGECECVLPPDISILLLFSESSAESLCKMTKKRQRAIQ